MEHEGLSRLLILGGLLLIICGLFLRFDGRWPLPGRLPGDFVIHRGRTTLYLPLGTSLVISLLLTLLLRLRR